MKSRRKPAKRMIYSNYCIWEDYHADAEESLRNELQKEPSEEEVWEEVNRIDGENWNCESERLQQFFDGNLWLITGTVERWNGKLKGAFLFREFLKMLRWAAKDCDYFEIYDENGHLYLTCTHHDGTNSFEIRKVTEKGLNYYEKWHSGYLTDRRSERYICGQTAKHYSVLPRYAELEYGCPSMEYEKKSL